MRRKLAAILFADIESYSAMMQKDESLAFAQGKRFKTTTSKKAVEYHGKVWQFYGDGALCIFDSAVEAIECAVALQRDFTNHPHLPVRMGIHTGEVIMDDEDIYGDGINISARIEPLCEPGGVYISGKAYDEIKNHKWLKAFSLGKQSMKNIDQDIEVYAIYNRGIAIPKSKFEPPERELQEIPKQAYTDSDYFEDDEYEEEETKYTGKHKKWVASLLAFFFGIMGVHRLYLGKKLTGIMFLVAFFISMIITVEEGVPAVAFVGAVAFIDFLLLATMSKAKFNDKYNTETKKKSKKEKSKPRKRRRLRLRPSDELVPEPLETTYEAPKRFKVEVQDRHADYKAKGMKLYKNYELEAASSAFQQALSQSPGDPEIYFMLAKCYSLLEKSHHALNHLAEAVQLGMKELSIIHSDPAFAHIRKQDSFEVFVRNGYKLIQHLPSADKEIEEAHDILDLEELKNKRPIKLERKEEKRADDYFSDERKLD